MKQKVIVTSTYITIHSCVCVCFTELMYALVWLLKFPVFSFFAWNYLLYLTTTTKLFKFIRCFNKFCTFTSTAEGWKHRWTESRRLKVLKYPKWWFVIGRKMWKTLQLLSRCLNYSLLKSKAMEPSSYVFWLIFATECYCIF